jgi:concanavalin A-like lectin/glucanase superfamily protein
MRHRSLRRAAVAGVSVLAGLALPQVAAAATVSLWHMDETSGTTMHDSVGANHGALTNIALGQPGYAGTAYGFNGASSIVKVSTSPTLNPGSNNFSYSLHAAFSAVPSVAVGDYDLIRKGLSSTLGGEWKMEILRSGQASCHLKGSSGSGTVTKGPNLANGAWHTITCIKQPAAISLVVDGTTYSKTVTIGSISNSAKLTIGAKVSGADWHNGLIDEASFSIG